MNHTGHMDQAYKLSPEEIAGERGFPENQRQQSDKPKEKQLYLFKESCVWQDL